MQFGNPKMKQRYQVFLDGLAIFIKTSKFLRHQIIETNINFVFIETHLFAEPGIY